MTADLQVILDTVEGYLQQEEAEALYGLASTVKDGVVLEIGAHKGKSTCCLAAGAKVPVYTMDAWFLPDPSSRQEKFRDPEVFEDFKRNLGMFSLKATPLIGLSNQFAKIWTLPIGMLFIDGNHGYRACREDLANYTPHLIEGGILAVHDYRKDKFKGVVRAVDEIKDGYNWTRTRSLFWGVKK